MLFPVLTGVLVHRINSDRVCSEIEWACMHSWPPVAGALQTRPGSFQLQFVQSLGIKSLEASPLNFLVLYIMRIRTLPASRVIIKCEMHAVQLLRLK